MWFRSELKERAKAVLKVSYWKAFLVSLVIAITGGAGRSSNIGWRNNSNRWNNSGSILHKYNFSNIDNYVYQRIWTILGISVLIVIVIGIAFSIFVGEPLAVGGRKYFVQSAKGDVNMNYLGYSFKEEGYMDIVKAMLWRNVITFLWLLLFIIPGIIKSYAYRMVPYILADNPNIGYKRALELSNQMTGGEKFNMFVLDLSFLGWNLLGLLLCGIGGIFVRPYENATEAELYLVLKQNAIDNNLCTPYELGVIDDITDDFY